MTKQIVNLDGARAKRERSEKKARTRRVSNLNRAKHARFERAVGPLLSGTAERDWEAWYAVRRAEHQRNRERRKVQYRDVILRLAKMCGVGFEEMEACLDQRVNDSSHITGHVEAMIDIESYGAAEALVYDEAGYWRGIAAQAEAMAAAIDAGKAGWGITWGCEPQYYLDQRFGD